MRRGVILMIAAAATAGILGGCGGSGRHAVAGGVRSATTTVVTVATTVAPVSVPPSTTTVPRPPPTPEPATTMVATLAGNAPASRVAGGPPVATVPGTWYGYRSVLPVIATTPGWLEVREAQRPNGSTAWMPAADATLSLTPYFLVLNLSTERLQAYLHGEPILSFPAGVGTTTDPTVTGSFFITMKVPPPDPGYGPFVLVTSAHSDAITDWGGSGDAITAIHGPIDAYDDQLIGTTGARISHGCIRLHDVDLAQLAGIPAGTPLDIVS